MTEEEKYRGLDSDTDSSETRTGSRRTKTPLQAEPETEEQDDNLVQSRKLILNLWDRYGREY
jgi:hypothetical protein